MSPRFLHFRALSLPLALIAFLATSAAFASERLAHAMGTWLKLELPGPASPASLSAGERALQAIEETEARLSTWRKDSDLTRLNHLKIGEALKLSPLTAKALALAHQCERTTGRAFHPGLGALLQAWKVREGFRIPSSEEIALALRTMSSPGFRLGPDTAERINEGYLYEEGAFAKGLALDQALRELPAGALLNFGGQLSWKGKGKIRPALRAPVASPEHRDQAVVSLELPESGSLATSGNSERGRGGFSHILDPSTGRGAPDFGSVTVLVSGTEDAAFWADCLSTALYVLGPSQGLAWLEEIKGKGAPALLQQIRLEAIYIERSSAGLVIKASSGLRDKIATLNPTHPYREVVRK